MLPDTLGQFFAVLIKKELCHLLKPLGEMDVSDKARTSVPARTSEDPEKDTEDGGNELAETRTTTSNPLAPTESLSAAAVDESKQEDLDIAVQSDHPPRSPEVVEVVVEQRKLEAASGAVSVLTAIEELILKKLEKDAAGSSDEETCTLTELLEMFHTRMINKEQSVPLGTNPKSESNKEAVQKLKVKPKSKEAIMKSKVNPSDSLLYLQDFEEMITSDTKGEQKPRIRYHTIVVNTFHPDFIEIQVRLPQNCLIVDLKHRVKYILGLKIDSIDMFGFFEGTLGCPVQHIPDDKPVQSFTNLCFMRLSFDRNYEFNATEYDNVALQLLYYELANMVKNEKLASRTIDLKVTLNRLTSAATPEGPITLFVQRVKSRFLVYWVLYYHSCFCIVQNFFRAIDYHLSRGDCLHVALNLNNLMLFEDKHILCFFTWSTIQMVKHRQDIETVKFYILVGSSISILELRSHDSRYIFSLAVHIIKLAENMASIRSAFRHDSDYIGNELVFFHLLCTSSS